MRRYFRPLAVVLAIVLLLVGMSLASAIAPANEHFQRTWARTDQPVLSGAVARTWVWGPQGNTPALEEDYLESRGGKRTVQYFDKSRMEINNPDGDPASPFYVTNGLLVVELMTGRLQLGNDRFEQYLPAAVNVAGDPGDPDSPTYADLALLRESPPLSDGAVVTQRVDGNAAVTNDPSLATHNVTAAHRVTVPGIDHQVASPFWEFLNSSGPVIVNGVEVNERLFDPWFYATGYPVTEAYWADVKVGGTVRLVLMQCFERRCLTYTPGNPQGFLTEAGNVGQHYHTWRYEQNPTDPTPTTTSPANETPTGTPTVLPTQTSTATPEPATDYQYVTRWGGQYTPIDRFKLPWGLDLDSDGNIWMIDEDNHRVLQFDSNGVYLQSFGSQGTANGQFQYPRDVMIHEDLVFVADRSNDRIQVFNPQGGYLYGWGTMGAGNGQFFRPSAIAIHNDTVYVADAGNNRIQMFTIAGGYVGQFGSKGTANGQFDTPVGLTFDDEGNLFVADTSNHRIQVFSGLGTYIRQFGSFGAEEESLYFPYEIGIDSNDNAYVTNGANGIIQKFDPSGDYIGEWEYYSGLFPGIAKGIYINAQDHVFLTDNGLSGRVQKFDLAGNKHFEISDSRRSRFNMINGLAVDAGGDVLVADAYVDRPTVGRYSDTGTPLDDLLLEHLGTDNTGDPHAVAVSHDGFIYIAVGGVNRIVKVSSDWGYYGNFGGTGSGQGQFITPLGLATDSAGNVYVADSGNNRIQKFDEDGQYITQWGTAGSGDSQFNKLQDITVYGNRLYAADFANNRIQIFDLNGTYIGQFGEDGSGPGQMSFPTGVEVNEYGYILVVEHGNNRVQLFNPDGEPVSTFGTAGSAPGQLSGPMAIAIDDDGYVYISDLGNYSVHKFAPVP